MKLFYSPGACSLAPHIVLRESGQTFNLSKVDIGKHLTAQSMDYYTINAKGMVPVLELDDGSRLSEGPVIAQFIADRAGATTLMPPTGTIERYRVMEWQNYITSELHKSFSPLFNAELDTTAKLVFKKWISKKLTWVDGQLADQDFLTGKTFTAADAYLFTVLGWASYVDLNISDLANIQRFLVTVSKRPAVREAMIAEGLITAESQS